MIDIITVVNGILEENCYIVHNGQTCLIVDPGSEAEKIIQSLGYEVFDLDIISREIFEKEEIKKNIFSEFQTLNRSEIGKIIFKNTSKKEMIAYNRGNHPPSLLLSTHSQQPKELCLIYFGYYYSLPYCLCM